MEAEANITLGRVIATTGRDKFDKAKESILKGIMLLDELQLKPRYAVGLLYLGELFANAGRKDKTLENIKTAEKMFLEMGMDYWPGKAKELLAKL